jgi:hypothetical protein
MRNARSGATGTVGMSQMSPWMRKLDLGGAGRPDGFAQVAAHIVTDAQGQVAVHPGAVGAAEVGFDVEQPGKARGRRAGGRIGGLPAHPGRAVGIGALQADLVQVDLDAFALQAPAGGRLQPAHRDQRVLEDVGQLDMPVGDQHLGAAPVLIEFEVDTGTGHTRPSGQGVEPGGGHAAAGRTAQAQGLHHATGTETPLAKGFERGLGVVGLPGGIKVGDLAFGLQAVQPAVGGRPQRQAGGHLTERAQVDAFGPQHRRGGAFATGNRMTDAQHPARPDVSVTGSETQVIAAEAETVGVPVGSQATLQTHQVQLGQIGTQPGPQVLQVQLGGDRTDLAALHVGPGLHAALAGEHLDVPLGQVDVATQPTHVDAGKLGVQLAAPVVPWPGRPVGGVRHQIEQGLAQAGAQAEALAPFGRRCGVQPHLVLPAAVAHHQIQLPQRQRSVGLGPQLVGPAHGALADDELGLVEEPVARLASAVVVAAADVQPGHFDPALGGAPHVEDRRVDDDLFDTQPPQRGHGHRHVDLRQQQGFLAPRVEQAHVAQCDDGDQGRQQALFARGRLGAQFADAHRYTHTGADPSLHGRAPLADSRHNPQVEGSPAECEQSPGGQHDPQQQSGGHRKDSEGSRGSCDRRRALIHVQLKL